MEKHLQNFYPCNIINWNDYITIVTPDNESIDKGMEKPGEDGVRYTFRDPGHYMVRCSIHPRMKMAVTVQ